MRIEFLHQPDDASEMARAMRDMMGIFARIERQKIFERTSSKRRARAREGFLNPSNTPPFGYSWPDMQTKAHYVIDEESAAVVRRIFEEVAAGHSLRTLCKQWNSEGILPAAAYHAEKGRLSPQRAVSPYWRPNMISAISPAETMPLPWGCRARTSKLSPSLGKGEPICLQIQDLDASCLAFPGFLG